MGYIRHEAVIAQLDEFDETKKTKLKKQMRVLRAKIKKAGLPPLLRGPHVPEMTARIEDA